MNDNRRMIAYLLEEAQQGRSLESLRSELDLGRDNVHEEFSRKKARDRKTPAKLSTEKIYSQIS